MRFPFAADFRATLAARCREFPRLAHDGEGLSRAAVAIALVGSEDQPGEAAFLLTRRSADLRAHAGQWALPGGRCDPGETAEQAAARELEEELGVTLAPGDVLGCLDDYATRSGYAITPVIAWVSSLAELRLSPLEVASAHRIPLAQIAAEGAVTFEAIPESDRPIVRVNIGDQSINAPTAAMVYQFRELVLGRVTRVAHLEQPVFAWR